MNTSPSIVAALVLVACMAVGGATPGPQSAPPAAASPADQASIPVGGVVLWWGLESEIPDGFEVCDGRVATTKGAKLTVRKPDLRGRIPVGALNEFGFRPWSPNTDTLGALTLPPHDHSLAEHTHTLDGHVHSLAAHTHPIDAVVQTMSVIGGDEQVHDITYLSPTAPGKGSVTTGPATGSTGGPVPNVTSGPTPARTGPAVATPAGAKGAARGARGAAGAAGETPKFTQFLFIIRVR